jgi:hypothetical protein
VRRALLTLFLFAVAILSSMVERGGPSERGADARGRSGRTMAGLVEPLLFAKAAKAAKMADGDAASAEAHAKPRHGEVRATHAAHARLSVRAFVRDTLRGETRAEALWDDVDDDDDDDTAGTSPRGSGKESDGPDTDDSFAQGALRPAQPPRVLTEDVAVYFEVAGLGPSVGHAQTVEPPPRS